MALLDINYFLWSERGPVHPILDYLHATIYPLPTDMDGYAQASVPIAFLGHLPYGSGNDRQYGGFCVCPSMGA